MATGLVFGKFYPPHLGHKMLIEWAARSSDPLIVLVIGKPDDAIPVDTRARWIREIHNPQGARNIFVRTLVTDQREDYDDMDVYRKWNFLIQNAIFLQQIDYLYTSEPKYGPICASLLGAKHVLVDPARKILPVSGTLVRANPYKQWAYLDLPVRAHYAKRICLLGAESTGTTTTTKALAEMFDTNWVPEYGRSYTIPKYRDNEAWEHSDFRYIAETQIKMEDEAAKMSNRLLFCDTDALTTALFERHFMGSASKSVEAVVQENNRTHRYDLTFLTYPDIPWEDDGLRDSPEVRQKMHEWFLEAVRDRPEPVVHLMGTLEQRLETARKAIAETIGFKVLTYEPIDKPSADMLLSA
jgi:HTH-type transcriptional repressor of NAD biosynthesis genes